MRTLCVLAGHERDAWRGVSRADQEEALAPWFDETKHRWLWSNAGELFIVDRELGGMPDGEGTGVELERLQAARAAERQLERLMGSVERAAVARTVAAMSLHLAPQVVALQEAMIGEGLDPAASDAAKDRAVRVGKDVLDRLGGRAVQGTEDVGQADGDTVRAYVASRQPSVLPVSATVTVEQAGDIAMRELEAGLIDVSEVDVDE